MSVGKVHLIWIFCTCLKKKNPIIFCFTFSFILISSQPFGMSPDCFLSLKFFGIFFYYFFFMPSVPLCVICSVYLSLLFYFSSPNAHFYYSTHRHHHSRGLICVCERSGTFIVQLFVHLELDLFKASQCSIFGNNILLCSVLLSSKCIESVVDKPPYMH